MNQGKLDVVKQEMARLNINILGISELKWTGMGEFNSDDHYIYYCEKTWFTGEGIQHSFLEDHINGMKKQKDMILKDKLTVQ